MNGTRLGGGEDVLDPAGQFPVTGQHQTDSHLRRNEISVNIRNDDVGPVGAQIGNARNLRTLSHHGPRLDPDPGDDAAYLATERTVGQVIAELIDLELQHCRLQLDRFELTEEGCAQPGLLAFELFQFQ